MIENLKNYRNFVLNSKFKIILNFYYFIFQLRKEKQIIYIDKYEDNFTVYCIDVSP